MNVGEKRNFFTKQVSNAKINKIYDHAIKKAAIGGKLTGAGGGGGHSMRRKLRCEMYSYGTSCCFYSIYMYISLHTRTHTHRFTSWGACVSF